MNQGLVVSAGRRLRGAALRRQAGAGASVATGLETGSPVGVAAARAADAGRTAMARGRPDQPTSPLAVIEIDHAQLDVAVVDEVDRRPLGRPSITVALDVYSRMVLGLYLSFDVPSAHAIGACLSHAILPKEDYLADLLVAGRWPVWGFPRMVRMDNTSACRDEALARACSRYGIDLDCSPAGRPRSRSAVEGLIVALSEACRELPGATRPAPVGRKTAHTSPEGAMALRELEARLVDFVVNTYHQRPHDALGMAPIRQWEIGLNGTPDRPGTGVPCKPSDPGQVRLDFLSPETLTGHRAPRR